MLTEEERRILTNLRERALDVYDLRDATGGMHIDRVYSGLVRLKRSGLIEWAYPEDEAVLSEAGRAALEEKQG